MNQATQEIPTFDRFVDGERRDVILSLRRQEVEPAMGSLAVVVLDVGHQDRAEMAFAQEEHPIEALGADRPDEPFGIGVGLRCPPRSAQYLDPLGPEHLVEDWAESLVPVMDQVVDRSIVAFSRLGQVSGDLGAPGGVGGAVGHSADEDLPRVQVYEEEHMEGLQANGLDGEEVTR